MQNNYKPDLGGFANKLGLKNGIEDLIKRPVPSQEILYFRADDINGEIIDGKQGNQYNKPRNFYPKRKRGRRWTI